MDNLRILAAFEEWRNANESNVIIPEDSIFTLIAGDLERVLEDYRRHQHWMVRLCGDMATVLPNFSHGIYLESSMLRYKLQVISSLVRRIVYLALKF